MRKVMWGAAVSLDLYLAGPDEALDWLRWSDDAAAIGAASWQNVDTLLMGRKTYDFAARSGGGGDAAASKIRTFIFSRTMAEAPAGAELVASDPAAFVRQLKREEGGDIIVMGGGELAGALIEGGVGRRDRAQRPSRAARRRHTLLPPAGPPGGAGFRRGAPDRQGLRLPALPACLMRPGG